MVEMGLLQDKHKILFFFCKMHKKVFFLNSGVVHKKHKNSVDISKIRNKKKFNKPHC